MAAYLDTRKMFTKQFRPECVPQHILGIEISPDTRTVQQPQLHTHTAQDGLPYHTSPSLPYPLPLKRVMSSITPELLL